MNEGRSYLTKKNVGGEILADFLLLNAAFFLAVLLKRSKIVLDPQYRTLLLVYYALWVASSLLSKKYKVQKPKNLEDGLRPFKRSLVYLAFLLFFVIFVFKLFAYSRFIILVSALIYAVLTLALYSFIYFYFWGPNVKIEAEENGLAEKSRREDEPEVAGIDGQDREIGESLKTSFQESFGADFPELYAFLDDSIRLEKMKASQSILLETTTAVSIRSLLKNQWEFIGNLGMLNGFQRINSYFIQVNEKLVPGGYFLGVGETFRQRFQRRFSKFPRALKRPLYFVDFVWHRAFPKIVGLKKIYFAVHGKRDKVISQHEIFGRLIFCGFGDIKFKDIDNRLYFVAKKCRPPLEDKNPSYGLIFKQKRIGLAGEPIYTFKLRTMYPYSEYIHRYVLKKNKLTTIGKIEDDPRITGWGRILRRYWIDELPMLINFIQGDLKLVGLRPVSMSFLSLYPEELRAERLKFKPAVMPALYADRPKSIEEIFESERKYMKTYQRHPRRTDFAYFFKILNSIFFHKARSA